MKITVVGAGYAGTMALGRLRMALPNAELTLVEPRTHFQARIHLHEVAAGGQAPHRSIAAICARWGATHIQERLVSIEGRSMQLETRRLYADAVLLCLGSRTRTPPGPAHRLDDEASSQALAYAIQGAPDARVTVIGSGTTALETATALKVAHPQLRLTLWHTSWPRTPRGVRQIERRLETLGIAVFEGARVETLTQDRAWSSTHGLDHDLAVWCAGFEAIAIPGLPTHPDGRLAVDGFLHMGDGVFAAGDQANTPSGYTMGCVSAMPSGAHAASNVVRWLHGEPLEPFRFRVVLTCTALGASHGLVEVVGSNGVLGTFAGVGGGITKSMILGWVRAAYALESRLGLPLYDWAKSPNVPNLQLAGS